MTKKSLMFFGACALAGAAAVFGRRATDPKARASRRSERCERLLAGLGERCANFR